ncbi:hypothetical protein [Mycobacterium seoulense]|uniref:hypothetical protein n=1 Tax=Mycobacterium seoulense TaxID=386911 RepID=UPI003CE89ED4
MTDETARPKVPLSYTELAEMEPKASVLLMFTNLEGLLKRSFKREYPDEKRPGTMAALTETLLEKGVIDAGLKAKLDKLRARRNDVVHEDPQVSRQEADDYFNSLGDALVELTRTSLYQ